MFLGFATSEAEICLLSFEDKSSREKNQGHWLDYEDYEEFVALLQRGTTMSY